MNCQKYAKASLLSSESLMFIQRFSTVSEFHHSSIWNHNCKEKENSCSFCIFTSARSWIRNSGKDNFIFLLPERALGIFFLVLINYFFVLIVAIDFAEKCI